MTSANMSSFTNGALHNGKAWLDVESEPKVFQDIVQKLGAKGVNVQEVYGLDENTFAMLSGSVQGLIFLFNYRGVDGEEKEESVTCPQHVWFANQTANNACATVALMNMLLNIPGLKFENASYDLAAFRASTAHLKPVERGEKLGESTEIRQVHNSFARNIEALNAALSLKNDFAQWKKSRNRKKVVARRSTGKKKTIQDDDSAFHYIAYVPVRGEVWRLDGLLAHPLNLGAYKGDDWTSLARDNISKRIMADTDLSYNVMALCSSEIQDILQRSLKVAVAIKKLEKMSVSVGQDPGMAKQMSAEDLNAIFGLTQEEIARNAALARDTLARLGAESPTKLWEELVVEQEKLKTAYLQQKAQAQLSDGAADGKDQNDDTDTTYEIMKTLIEAGLLGPYFGQG